MQAAVRMCPVYEFCQKYNSLMQPYGYPIIVYAVLECYFTVNVRLCVDRSLNDDHMKVLIINCGLCLNNNFTVSGSQQRSTAGDSKMGCLDT